MSIFNEILPDIFKISNSFTKNINDSLKDAILCIDRFEEEYKNGKGRTRVTTQKDKSAMTNLQSIHEDEDEPIKLTSTERVSTESTDRTGSKKRSKNEVDGINSPEVEKRQKRNASIKAQTNIAKQVNVNLTQKLRRNGSFEKSGKTRQIDDDKENAEPVPLIQVKQEKISLPPEPMDSESSSVEEVRSGTVREQESDEIAMPPPMALIPKTRKALKKETSKESEEETKRPTRTRKQTDTASSTSSRSLRASSRRSAKQTEEEQPPEARPKRTRAKKVIESATNENAKDNTVAVENGTASPADKPRPKRTRRGQKAAEQEQEKQDNELEEQQEKHNKELERQETAKQVKEPVKQRNKKEKQIEAILISPKKERISEEVQSLSSPVLPVTMKAKNQKTLIKENTTFDQTRVINEMDQTKVLSNGVYNHEPVTPKAVRQMNETVVIEKCNQTVVLDKQPVMNETVVIEKAPQEPNISEDNSLLTDDSDTIEHTPPHKPPVAQPISAVKEKVQQFEEMATGVTRTKTRAMAKKEEATENHTPPDKTIPKAVISTDTLTKMNNLIFSGKPTSSSASKPRVNTKSQIPQSVGKLSTNKREEVQNEIQKENDARRKKEALLEAKREQQRRKREEKMAAAAAARVAAERERRAVMEAAAKERLERQAHVDLGKIEKLKEVERKKQELARKVAETEERRKAEELARQQKLAEELKRAGDRKKQLLEAEANKKEAALVEKDMERKMREFREKQKMKNRLDGDKIHTPFKLPTTPQRAAKPPLEPVYMADGFQYLNSDEEAEPVEHVPPAWSVSKARHKQLYIQSYLNTNAVDTLFGVRKHTPDLREIFPNIERNRLKRTSSAVWRTPPSLHKLPDLTE